MDDNAKNYYSKLEINEDEINRIINKYKAQKNNVIFDFCTYLCFNKSLNKKKQLNNIKYENLESFLNNVLKNFDIFNYLKNLKRLELSNKILLNDDQNYFIDLLSYKFSNYGVLNNENILNLEKFQEYNFQEKNESIKIYRILNSVKDERNKKILDFLLF